MKKILNLVLFAAFCLFLGSCGSSKHIAYFQNADTVDLAASKGLFDARIMPKDLLTITVSTTDPKAATPFNLSVTNTLNSTGTLYTGAGSLQTYLVDNDGFINFPVVGQLKVGGMTKRQCENYIREKMKGDAGDADAIAEIVENTYGWNVMKPQAIDGEMWDEIYDVYVKDSYGLGVKDFFEDKNPAALQEMTAVMMESARKGLWNASDAQLSDIAGLHTYLIDKYRPACSGTVCDNAPLRDFIASRTDAVSAEKYLSGIRQVRETAAAAGKGVVMKKEEIDSASGSHANMLDNTVIVVAALAVVAFLIIFVRRRRRQEGAETADGNDGRTL